MDQQQLQLARAALWRQTAAADPSAPLRTLDDAARWLDDIGFCLYLPRHTQLPAPAPSFVEACLGAPSVTPPPAAIAQASELLTRLVAERRAIPLNLLGAFSEQPDFLVTPEILPWVAAVRGDRQWKTAPGGRTSPIVVRTFEILDQKGERTAIQLREELGREITEAAALRALMELWTGLRAMPIYAAGEPARWTLLKNRFATQLATAANASQTTALSAVASLYLRSAVAATAEEAEIFLSPLTARSRIREVLHGMMATRQLATTPVATQTLLFLEGSLPETVPAPETKEAAPAPEQRPAPRAPRLVPRKEPRPTKWELPHGDSRPQPEPSRPWQKKPAEAHRIQPGASGPGESPRRFGSARPGSAADRPRREGRPFAGSRPNAGPRPALRQRSGSGPRPVSRPGPRFGSGPRPGGAEPKPWQRRNKGAFGAQPFPGRKFPAGEHEGQSPAAGDRPKREEGAERESRGRSKAARPGPFRKAGNERGNRPWQGPRAGAPAFRKDRESGEKRRPWKDRPVPRGERPAGDSTGAENRSARPSRPFRPGKPFAGKPGGRTGSGENRSARPSRPFRPGKPFAGKPGGRSGSGENRSARPSRPFRPGKPFAGKSFSGKPGRPAGRSSGSARPGGPKNKFRKPSPAERKPRKNRSQKETPE